MLPICRGGTEKQECKYFDQLLRVFGAQYVDADLLDADLLDADLLANASLDLPGERMNCDRCPVDRMNYEFLCILFYNDKCYFIGSLFPKRFFPNILTVHPSMQVLQSLATARRHRNQATQNGRRGDDSRSPGADTESWGRAEMIIFEHGSECC